MDHNPSFGRDERFEGSARRVADMLWEATGGNLKAIPQSYLSTLSHEYSDGAVSLLHQLNKVSLTQGTYEEFREVVESLLYTFSEEWPVEDSILEIQAEKLKYEIEPPTFEFDFAESGDMSEKVELFLKKVISSVYLDGVTDVTDEEGNPPNTSNNYLMSRDAKSFSGVFYDAPRGETEKQYPFSITETSDGEWEINY